MGAEKCGSPESFAVFYKRAGKNSKNAYTIDMTLVETITNELHRMSTDKLVEVARFVSNLVPEVSQRQREALASAFGSMDDEEGARFEAAVFAPEVTEPDN